MFTSCFLYVFLTCIVASQGFHHSNNHLKSKNGLMLTKITNDNGTSTIYHTEFFDKEKKLFALKNEMTKECILKQVDDQVNILNFKNKYDQNMELTEDEMVEIIGENLRNFCKDKIIILNNFDNKRFSRSKRATDKKRYQGQTQTQFVSFGSKNSNQETKNGLAEALSQPDLSRATVSGLNGMGQAQSQSSFGECNECSGQDYQTHSTHEVNSHPGYFPSLRPLNSVSQNQNSRPYYESNTNRQSPGLQDEESQRGYSINHKYPDTYSGSGTSNKLPGSQVHGYNIRPSIDGQYSGSRTNYKVPGKQNQEYVINDQYPRSETNNKQPDNQNYGYGITPSVDNQYISSETNNQLPGNQDPRYGTESTLYGQYPSKIQGPKSNNNTELGKINPGYVYNSANEQIQNLANTNTPEYKKAVNNDTVKSNSHSINSIPFNPSSWSYPNKIDSNTPNINQQIYPDGLGFPKIPSESGQGILTPHNTPNFDSTHPSNNWQVPVTTSINHQNKPSNYPSSVIPNYQHPTLNVLDQLTPYNPISSDTISQNKQRIINEAGGPIQNGYPLSSNIPRGQDYTQINLPSLCTFLYQTCLNALSNNKRLNEFQIASSQNNVRNPNVGKLIGNTQVPITQHPGFPFYGEGINQNQPNSGQPQYTIGLVGSSIQHPSYTQIGGNINRFQSSYGQPQDIIGSSGSGAQQPGYAPFDKNVNQIQPIYGQPQSTLESGGSGFQQPGYFPSNGNVNQMQPNHGILQSTLGSSGSGVQQLRYAPFDKNVNQMQPIYGQPQSTLESGGSDFQQPGYFPSSGSVNQIQPNYGQPQITLGSGGSGVHQPGYGASGGSVNQMQPNYGQPQSTSGSSRSGVQQPEYGPSGGNVNQMQPNYGQPQSTSSSSGSGVHQPGYGTSGGNVNQMQPNYGQPQSTSGSSGSGVHQPGYGTSGGNVNQMQPNYGQPQSTSGSSGSGVQQPEYGPPSGNVNQMQPNYGQPQSTSGSSGSGVHQPGYGTSGGNVNQMQPNYGQPQSTSGSSGSGVQQPEYGPSSGNVNQMHPNYGQPQSTSGSSGSGVHQPGYGTSGGNVNQMQPNYGQPQSTSGSSGSGVHQPGYGPSSGNVNHMHSNYGQPQSTLESNRFGEQPEYGPSGGNVNQMHPNYGQPQSTLGSGGSGVHQPGYGASGGSVNQMHPNYGQPQSTSGPGVQQPGYDSSGRNLNQIQPELYGDNSFRDPSLKPGSEIGNINPLTNPIIGGQFGTDISSGGSVTLIDTEGGDAQSMTNVDVDGQETRASASAQGKSKTGMSQTQVSGSYLGTGMFSAQAQTSDSDKGAQSQIVSNTNGTTSTAQGKGGRGQAQSQVLYNADNGIALGEAQSSGINYGTNTQLQAGIKGGMADAQSTGLGSTSSQAQIGFLPHESNNSTNQKSLFKGGGTTSAQGGSNSGQSQSQLFGSYKHGISYNGAAQASTGKKLQNFPKLNLADAKLKIGQLEGSTNDVKNQTNALNNLQSIPNTLRSQNQIDNSNVDNHKQQNISSTQTPPILSQEPFKNVDAYSEYEDNDEYDDDNDEIVNTKSVQTKKETIPKQEQNIILNLDDKHDAQIIRDSDSQLKSGQVLNAGQVIPGTNGTKIPNGFRGRVASVAGDHTEAQAIPGGQAQTQTVHLTPGVGSLTVVDKTKLRAQLNKESYVRPTNSFQTEINGGISKFKANENNVQYFTKSSTCGYFSFSCNYVNGATNGAKICKPNPPPFPCQRSN